MKSSWHAWLLYGLCLLVIIPAMVWLSLQVLALEKAREASHRETELARQSAELQERVSSALWRMDGMLMPLVAQEAARPHFVYDAFYDRSAASTAQANPPANRKGGQDAPSAIPSTPSPLLFQPSDYVVLNFEAGPDGQLRSPQIPTADEWGVAQDLGFSQDRLLANNDRLAQIGGFFDYGQVLAQCPTVRLPNDIVPLEDGNGAPWDPNPSIYIANQKIQRVADAVDQNGSDESFQDQNNADLEQALQQQKALPQANAPPNTGGYGKGDYGSAKINERQMAYNSSRGTSEFEKRSQTIQSQSYNLWSQNRLRAVKTPFVREGVMKALWLGDHLVLARRVYRDEAEVIQCCWLDWDLIETALASEVSDLLPGITLEPVRDEDNVRPEMALAALPAQLATDPSDLMASLGIHPLHQPPPASGLKLGLWVAWSCLGIAAIASATLLHGVLQLNERRAAFVSAVTHELRTPLTTFRMYAEMLAERMVPSPEKQQEYAQTLKVEADRLAHLVENVLQFARLERGNHDDLTETLTIDEIFSRFSDRLSERAAQANMQIEWHLDPDFLAEEIETTPSAFEQIIFNLVDNACKYARSATDRRIEIRGERAPGTARNGDQYCFAVRDYGPGVEDEKKDQLFKAFRKSDQDSADTAQGVGLGLALCRRIAGALKGSLELTRQKPGAEFLLRLPVQRDARR